MVQQPGRREGDILGFVRGLRFAARLTYFLRTRLSDLDRDINWGHLLDATGKSCSPECDIVIHTRGFHEEWNGGKKPIMDFKFILASAAKVVVSCKSFLGNIDADYPSTLKKFGVKSVFLFAECCEEKRFVSLQKAAKRAGYAGLYALYFTTVGVPGFKQDERLYVEFVTAIKKAASR